MTVDPTAARGFDPLVPRPLDRPTVVDLVQPDFAGMDLAKVLAAPDDPADWPRWREVLTAWRDSVPLRHQLRTEGYDRPEAQWSQTCYAVAQIWLWDELLYDAGDARFTPERLLADAGRFGGLDGVVLWHAYPVIGLDERNQWDYYRDVPGLADLVGALQQAGSAVFLDYNPWDTGTRRGADDAVELAALVAELGADGVFLDTLREGDPALVGALEQARPGIGLESESTLPIARISEHRLSWAQWFDDSAVPGVLRSHYLERRHQQHHVRRWHRSHAEELQSAFMNGIGVMVWEVVFGVWVGWSRRDTATLRRMLAVQRAASELLVSGEWTPLAALHPQATAARVFGSTFHRDGVTLYALVNRGREAYGGPLLPPGLPETVVDLTAGGLAPVGLGALVTLAPGVTAPSWLGPLRSRLAELPEDPDGRFPRRPSTRVGPGRSAQHTATAPWVLIPAGSHGLTVRYRRRETGLYDEAPFVDEWKPLPPRLHDLRTVERVLALTGDVAVAAAEVTAADFDAFVQVSGYRPTTAHRFRGGGDGAGGPGGGPLRAGPATYVDLGDARAYARWVGARLPTEDEWQVAAERAAEGGWSSAGVWNWTESEHTDGRTRFVILKGGSDYLAAGSEWYFDGGPQSPAFSAKLLVPGFGLARSSRIGFRLAWDLDGAPG